MDFRCPTCHAPWRHVTLCGRCGTDLTTVMQVAVRAWEVREAARKLLWAGDRPAEAVRLARTACQLQATQQAQKLLALTLLANHQSAEAHATIAPLIAGQAAPRKDSHDAPDE